jgi:hypothetical protein
MSDPGRRILEEQVDALAGRLADAEKRAARLLELLSRPAVLERLGLEAWEIERVSDVGYGGGLAAGLHAADRRKRTAKEEADLALRDLQRRVSSIEASERRRRDAGVP